MRPLDILLLLVAAVVGLFGLVILVGGSMNLANSSNPVGDLGFIVGIGILPLLGSLALVFYLFRRRGHRLREAMERALFDLAHSNNGHVTPIQAAQATSMTLDEAKAMLDHLHLSGHCQTHLDERGTISYHFAPLGAQPPS